MERWGGTAHVEDREGGGAAAVLELPARALYRPFAVTALACVRMTPRGTYAWIALALVGLAVAAGASLFASSLASQDIGLASEPLTASDDLAPPDARGRATRAARRRGRGAAARARRGARRPRAGASAQPRAPRPRAPAGGRGARPGFGRRHDDGPSGPPPATARIATRRLGGRRPQRQHSGSSGPATTDNSPVRRRRRRQQRPRPRARPGRATTAPTTESPAPPLLLRVGQLPKANFGAFATRVAVVQRQARRSGRRARTSSTVTGSMPRVREVPRRAAHLRAVGLAAAVAQRAEGGEVDRSGLVGVPVVSPLAERRAVAARLSAANARASTQSRHAAAPFASWVGDAQRPEASSRSRRACSDSGRIVACT